MKSSNKTKPILENKKQEAKRLLSEILDNIISSELTVTSILRKFLRVTQLLDLKTEMEWIDKELNGYSLQSHLPPYREILCAKRYSWRGQLPPYVTMYSSNIRKLSQRLPLEHKIYDSIPMLESALDKGLERILDREDISGFNVDIVVDLVPRQISEILEKLKNRIYLINSQLQIMLEFDSVSETIFNEARSFVDSSLQNISQNAFDKITTSYKDLGQAEDPIRASQIALTCIAALIDFSTAIYKDEFLPSGQEPPQRGHFVKKIKYSLAYNIGTQKELDYLDSLGKYITDMKDYIETNKHRSDL